MEENSFFLKIFVTYRCNLKCRHCVQSQISSRYKPAKDNKIYLRHINTFLTSAREKFRDIRIYVSGGEPLLSPNFFKIATMIKNQEITYKTITNGLLLGKLWRRFIEAPPEGIWITFNGTGRNHDRIVGLDNSYQQLCQSVSNSISHLQQAGIKVGAVLMINSLTHDRLDKDFDEIAAMGFDEVVLQHLSFLSPQELEQHRCVFKREFNRESHFCLGENVDGTGIDPVILFKQLKKVMNKRTSIRKVIFPPLESMEQLTDYYGDHPLKWKQRRCQRALREIWVHPDGTVAVCFSQEIGDISQSFEEIMQSPRFLHWWKTFQELSRPLPGCMRCHRLYM
jgi:MoaA/NifB/PqqE/SkfB family radical SAM enzyme